MATKFRQSGVIRENFSNVFDITPPTFIEAPDWSVNNLNNSRYWNNIVKKNLRFARTLKKKVVKQE